MIARSLRATFLGCLVVLGLLPAGQCLAYKPGEDFLWPSNYELVKEADAIVLAKATKRVREKDNEIITFQVLEVLKAGCKEKMLRGYGFTKEYHGASKRGDFGSARPGTYTGMGRAHDFKIGATYLLVLKSFKPDPRDSDLDTRWRINPVPLSRTSEEVTDGDPWIQAVRRYVEIATLGDYAKESAALKDLRAKAALGKEPEKCPPGLVTDIDRHFSSPYPLKSYEDLLAIYKAAAGDRDRKMALYAMAKAGHKEAAALMRQAASDETMMLDPLIAYMKKSGDAEGTQALMERMERNFKAPEFKDQRTYLAESMARLAGGEHKEMMLKTFEATDADAARRMIPWFKAHAPQDILPVVQRLVDRRYEKADGHIVMALAELGDEGVVDWALGKMAQGKGRKAAESVFPLVLIASSPLEKADKFVAGLVKEADLTTLSFLAPDLARDESANPRKWQHLRAIAQLARKSRPLREALTNSLKASSSPEAAEILRSSEAR